jgi:gluconolactonase
MNELEVVADVRALLGEGPVWNDATQQLMWVDILGRRIHAYDPAAETSRAWQLSETVTALCPGADGGYIVATTTGVARLDLERASLTPLAARPSGDRMNDAKADPRGRFVGGTLTEARLPGASGLYSFERADEPKVLASDVTVANGLGWSPDGALMYFADTPTLRIDVFDYDIESGGATNRRCFVDLAGLDGRPDGLTVDADGHVWVAMVRAGLIHRFSPRGDCESTITVPAKFVTSCGFGGSDLADLYITTGCLGMPEPEFLNQPHAGALFRLRTSTHGQPTPHCRIPR